MPSLKASGCGEGCAAFLAVPGVHDLIVGISSTNHIGQVRLNALMSNVAIAFSGNFAVKTVECLSVAHQHRTRFVRGFVQIVKVFFIEASMNVTSGWSRSASSSSKLLN